MYIHYIGMIQLHEANIIHGDIKPQNILLTDTYVAKLADFGLAYWKGKTTSQIASTSASTLDDDEVRAVVAGTSAYMAPELLNASVLADYSSDVYSFGILLNELCVEV